jgi:hypothetical protein
MSCRGAAQPLHRSLGAAAAAAARPGAAPLQGVAFSIFPQL